MKETGYSDSSLQPKSLNSVQSWCLPVWHLHWLHCNIFLCYFYLLLDVNSYQLRVPIQPPSAIQHPLCMGQDCPTIYSRILSLLLHQVELSYIFRFHLTLEAMHFGCIGKVFFAYIGCLARDNVSTSQIVQKFFVLTPQ